MGRMVGRMVGPMLVLGQPGGMRGAWGRLQRGCRKLVKGQSLEGRRLLTGLRITDTEFGKETGRYLKWNLERKSEGI